MRTLTIFALLSAAAPVALLPGVAAAQYAAPSSANTDADELASQMRLLAANAQDLNAMIRAGELTLRLGDPTAAAGFFARAERIDPRNARIKAGLGSLLVGEERPGEALRRFAEAESLGGNVASFAADRGLAYDLTGEQERAQRDYRAALRYLASDETSRRYALSLGISGKRDQALAVLDPLLRRSDRGAWRDRAFILAMAGDRSGAERIATSMLPQGMAQGLQPFFERLPSLPAADRAFAVHFGEIRPTPARIADARMAPPLAALGPDPYAPVELAAAKAVPQQQSREDKRRNRKRKGAQIDVATTTPPIPLPPPPTYLASNAIPSAATAMVQPLPQTAYARPMVQPVPQAQPSRPMVQALPQTQPSRPMVQPVPQTQYSRATVQPLPQVATARATVQPVPQASVQAVPQSRASSVTVQAVPGNAPIRPAGTVAQARTLPSTQPATVVPQPVPAAATPLATAGAIPAESNVRVSAATPQPAPATSIGVAPAVVPAASTTVIPTTPLPSGPVSLAATPPPSVPASTAATPAPVRSEDRILAAIIAGIKVPTSEEERPAAPLSEVRPAARRSAIDKVASVPETANAAATTAKADADKKAADKKIADKKVADKKVADAKKAADLKKAEAKKEAEEKAKNDPKKLEPARIWVQVAGGANESTLPKEWSRLREKSPGVFKGKQAWTTPLRATNRLVVGPFKSDDDARDYINTLAKQGLSGFPFTSEAGQKMTKLPTK